MTQKVRERAAPPEGEGWVEIAEETVALDVGDLLVGVYLTTEQVEINGRQVARHVIGRDGQPDAVLLGSPVLDRKLARVRPGSLVQIACVDRQKTAAGREMRDFRVWVHR